MGRALQAEQAIHSDRSPRPIELARLERRFTRFRAEHPRGTRYPDELRQAALELLGEVEPEALYRACGLSFRQVMAWRDAGAASAQAPEIERDKVRVFSVVDTPPAVGVAPRPAAPEVTLQLGQWSVSVRLTWRGDACCP